MKHRKVLELNTSRVNPHTKHGQKINWTLGGFRVFGCEVWLQTTYQKKKKLEPRFQKGILISSLWHCNYRVWDIEDNRIIRARHVLFNEHILTAREWA